MKKMEGWKKVFSHQAFLKSNASKDNKISEISFSFEALDFRKQTQAIKEKIKIMIEWLERWEKNYI